MSSYIFLLFRFSAWHELHNKHRGLAATYTDQSGAIVQLACLPKIYWFTRSEMEMKEKVTRFSWNCGYMGATWMVLILQQNTFMSFYFISILFCVFILWSPHPSASTFRRHRNIFGIFFCVIRSFPSFEYFTKIRSILFFLQNCRLKIHLHSFLTQVGNLTRQLIQRINQILCLRSTSRSIAAIVFGTWSKYTK